MALVQTNVKSITVAATTASNAWTNSTKAGNTVIVAITEDSGTQNNVAAVSDSQGNVYTRIWSTVIAGVINHELWYSANIKGGAGSVTATIAGGGTDIIAFVAREYSGILQTKPLDRQATLAEGTTNTVHTSGATTATSQALELVIGTFADSIGTGATNTAGVGFGNLVSQASSTTLEVGMQDKIVSAIGTQTATYGSSPTDQAIVGVATFRYVVPTTLNLPYVNVPLSARTLNTGVIAAGSGRQIVRTSAGVLYAVITQNSFIGVYSSIDNGNTWSLQDYANTPKGNGTASAIAIDSTDKIHIIYTLSTTAVIYVPFNTTTNSFGNRETALTGTATIQSASIAVDSNNIPHIATGNSGTQVIYANRTTPSWPGLAVGSITSGTNIVQIAIDNNNVPQIVDASTGTGLIAFLGNKNNATSFTQTNIFGTTALTTGQTVDIATAKSNNTWIAFQAGNSGRAALVKHNQTDSWATWSNQLDDGFNGKNTDIAVDVNGFVYIIYERNTGGVAYDRYDSINQKWLGEQIIQGATPSFRPHHPRFKWSNYFNNGDTGDNNTNQQRIDYVFDDGTTFYYSYLDTAQLATGLVKISFTSNAQATTTSTSSTSSSTSTSTSSTSTSTSVSTSSTSTSTSHSTSSTSTSFSTSTSSTSQSTSTSLSTSTSSTSTSTSLSTSTSSTSTSTSFSTSSTSTSASTSSTSTSVSTSTSSTSASTSFSTSSTSTSTTFTTSTSSTSTSVSTSSTSQSTSTSTSSTSQSTSTSSTSTSQSTSTSSTSTSTSLSTSTSSTSQSTSTSLSTSSTSTSISTSSTSSSTSISTSSTSSSTSFSTSSTSTSTSVSTTTSFSTSSTSTSTTQSFTTSTSSTSSSTSISSTSSSTSTSTSTSSTSTSHSTSSTSTSTSMSTSSTSTSTSTSSTSTSASTSLSTSSTSSSVSTSTSSTSTSVSTSTSSTSTSHSTSSTSTSFSTSSTSSSTSTSLSTSSTSASTSTSFSTSSTSTSTSTSFSTSSTSQSTTISFTTSTSSTSSSTSSTSTSTTTIAGTDFGFLPRATIYNSNARVTVYLDLNRVKIRPRLD